MNSVLHAMQQPTAVTSDATDQLTLLAGRKHECLAQLHTLGRQQLELIDDDDLTQLIGLLSAKQRLLADLQRIERQLDPFRGQDPESRHWRSPDDRRRCAELIASCQTLFAEILAQEKTGESRLRRRRDETAARLSQAHQSHHARAAYAAQGTAFPAAGCAAEFVRIPSATASNVLSRLSTTDRLDLSCEG